ncbi:PRC-barrel domain-containing protein [Nocardioides sp.]|uniref:PRC-barrel domain-containing protein n=1 Tax=Nocardioides sp. TaxID=35761 RepID=UPI0026022B11|nr:PRC-barrel domain-containing protein [Nocardioides sp.]MCW2737694.1 hypothetical protein [Nocardioides sp.]
MDDIVWSYKNDDWIRQSDLVGYEVHARDGAIGTVDEASTEAARRWLVVDTGFWIFGKLRLIPAGTVSGVDHENEIVVVNMSKAAIKAAPDYDRDTWGDEAQGEHADYYGEFTDRHVDE